MGSGHSRCYWSDMRILMIGIIWIALSALMARPGFFNYCVWRAVADKSKDPDQIYLAAKPKLLSSQWLYVTSFTAALACIGLWILGATESPSLSQMFGLALFLIACGQIVSFHIVRAGRIWDDLQEKGQGGP